eukprot:COSAG06_NODE_54132_length_296_cov_0.786802_1_plen_79_part_01
MERDHLPRQARDKRKGKAPGIHTLAFPPPAGHFRSGFEAVAGSHSTVPGGKNIWNVDGGQILGGAENAPFLELCFNAKT